MSSTVSAADGLVAQIGGRQAYVEEKQRLHFLRVTAWLHKQERLCKNIAARSIFCS
jgi:hypothetical protein